MLRLLTALREFWLFGASILLTRGMALITIPLVTGRLAPSDYGRLELVMSVVEAFSIVMTLGLADSLFRFAGPEAGKHQRDVVAGLTGMALTLAVVVGALLQVGVWTLAPRFGLGFIQTPLAIGLAAATVAGLIELPLAWLRLRGHAGAFLAYTAARTLLQVAMMAFTLNAGFGLVGLLAGSATVDLGIAATLLILQVRECGVRLDRATFDRAGRYSLPLIGGALSMFVLGSCDRWFLAGAVPTATLGFYGLAVKLSLITPLVIQPFGLWWYARRIAILKQPGGLETSARGVAIGMTLLAVGAVASCVGAPILVNTLLPHAYRAALPFLPWLVLASVLNESCSLVNVGAYAGHHGYRVLAVNAAGAAVALAGYFVLTQPYGVWGAIAATLAGQSTRFALYVVSGRRAAPIRYPWGLAAALAGLALFLVGGVKLAPDAIVLAVTISIGLVAFAAVAWRFAGRDAGELFRSQPV
jgi:O-antigen/teichoic acid export membrane protein